MVARDRHSHRAHPRERELRDRNRCDRLVAGVFGAHFVFQRDEPRVRRLASELESNSNKTNEKSTSVFGPPRQTAPSRSGAPSEKIPGARIGVDEVWDVPDNGF